MKKENNLLVLIIRDIAGYAAEILLVLVAIIGVFYAFDLIVELFSGIVNLVTGLFILFAIAGMALYIDFKPEKRQPRGKSKATRQASGAASCEMLSVYPIK